MLELRNSKFCLVFVTNLPLYCILLVFWWLIYLVLDYANSCAQFALILATRFYYIFAAVLQTSFYRI